MINFKWTLRSPRSFEGSKSCLNLKISFVVVVRDTLEGELALGNSLLVTRGNRVDGKELVGVI